MSKKNIVAFDARFCMNLAIEEMKKSKNEPRPDGKVPPKVGAVIVFPNGDIVKAHRGELRDGDHAEYSLIERKLVSESLDDCVLFTTLEPCAERSSPKVPCCRRTTNARIRTIYVGIVDPDPTVSGKGILHLENQDAKVIMFDRDLQEIIEEENADFLKQALERKQKAEEVVIEATLEKVVSRSDFDELSAEALHKFVIEANLPYNIEQPEFRKYLENVGILAFDKKTNQLKPTGVGVLMFGFNPRSIFKQAVLKCTADFGNGQIETKDFDQPLTLIPDLVEEWIKRALPQIKDTSNFKRQENSIFPLDVLREAIINALVHRDYDIEGAKSYFQISEDSIIIKSPGAPVPSISIDQLNTFKAPSISRNPIITYIFNLMGYVEETGFGMSALKTLNEKYNLPLPEYHLDGLFLTLIFPRTLEAVKKVSTNAAVQQLSDSQISGYEWLKGMDEASTREYSAHFNIGYKTAQRHLARLKELNLISDNGEAVNSPNYKYVVLPIEE